MITAPTSSDTPVRMPIRPPAAIMTMSVSRRTVRSRSGVPRMLRACRTCRASRPGTPGWPGCFSPMQVMEALSLTTSISAEMPAADGQQLGLEQALWPSPRVQGVHDDARGPALRERLLLVVDEPPLQRKGEQHAQEGQRDDPDHRLVHGESPGRSPACRPPDRGHQRRGHVARRGGDRLHGVVFQHGDLGPRPSPDSTLNMAKARMTEVMPTPRVQPVLSPT